jgi:hypothetical protein
MGRNGAARCQEPGGESLWIVPKRPGDIRLGVCITANLVKQAAPGNVSTRVRFVGTSRG